MVFRAATIADIPQIQLVRNSVKENILSNPNLVTDQDCQEFITHRGKGWVCEVDGSIVGFAIADLRENNIWALFVDPNYEGQGIGRRLQALMLDWYFEQDKSYVWLGTAPNTRAERFYRETGWEQQGTNGTAELRFVMTKSVWEGL